MEMTMSHLRKLGMGMVMAAALAAPALAEDFSHDNAVFMYSPSGMKAVKVDTKTAEMMTKHAKEVTGPVMIMMKGGKTWIVENTKMDSGKMLWDYLNDPAYRGGA
jgi:hypothetical protein